MQPPHPPTPLPPLDRLLPPRGPALEQLCQLARQDRGWVGLVVESLLNGPLGLLVDKRFLSHNEAGVWQRLPNWRFVPMQIRHRKHGIHEFSHAVFSHTDYCFEIAPPPTGEQAGCFTFANGLAALEILAQPDCTPHPLVVDPTWPHSVWLAPAELHACLMAWHEVPAPIAADFCSFEFSFASAAMCARLREFLPQLPSVEQACIWRCALATRPKHARQTLFVRGADDASLARIRKALPLLNWGLPAKDAISLVTSSDEPLKGPSVYEA